MNSSFSKRLRDLAAWHHELTVDCRHYRYKISLWQQFPDGKPAVHGAYRPVFFITGKDTDLANVGVEKMFQDGMAERTGAAGDK